MKETKLLSCRTSTSISSLLGSVTSYAVQYVKSKFPTDFFKATYINDSLASIHLVEGNIKKLPKPTLVISPTYNGEDGIMGQLPYWQSTKYFTFRNPKKKYNGVLYDDVNDIYIYSIPDRIKINFSMNIKVPTVMYAYNVLHYLKQAFDTNNSMNYLNDVNLQTEIPKIYSWYIAQKLKADITTVEGREIINEYFQNNSYGGIHEKINLSNGNAQYAYNYKTNILCNFQDLPSLDKNINNMSVDSVTLNFQFSFEFWSHSTYLMEIKDNVNIDEFPKDLSDMSKMKYDLALPVDYIREIIGDKHLIIRKQFIPDVNTEVDILDLTAVLQKELINVIKEVNNNNFNTTNLFEVQVYANKQQVLSDLVKTDWKKFTVSTKEPMSNVTYTLLIYGNLKVLNEIDQYITNGELDKIKNLTI